MVNNEKAIAESAMAFSFIQGKGVSLLSRVVSSARR